MKKLLLVVLSVLTIIGVFVTPTPVAAQDIESVNTALPVYSDEDFETTYVPVKFNSMNMPWVYAFPYSDDWFKEDDGHYNHLLCQGSFGLTVAAFRLTQNELGHQDDSLIDYYKKAGFENIETYNYENLPSDDSISNGIASKKIDNFTLLAVGVCGSGYKDEWCSNLTIGEEERHHGFNSAAQQVEKRIYDYIEKYNITGDIKVWTCGFSRASAVSNLVAADLTDSGKFAGVFGYHFAVPNNTTELKMYDNIYCIVGKNDPVPYVSLEEWYYTRFGTTLYTPSREADSKYNGKFLKASAMFEMITGEQMKISPAINKSLRLILSNLLEMIPDRSVYVSQLQEDVLTAWHAKSNTNDLAVFLAGVLDEIGEANESIKGKTSALGEYILNLGLEFTTKNPNSVFASDLYENFGLAANLVREHQPMVYLSWLFSDDDPNKIFTTNLDFTRLFISGDVVISIYDDKGLIETFDHGLIKRSVPKDSLVSISPNTNFLYMKEENGKIEVIIPKDMDYLVQIDCERGQFTYEGVTFHGRSLMGKEIEKTTVQANGNNTYYILSRASIVKNHSSMMEGYELIESDSFTSPTVLLAMENSNVFHLTFKQMKTFGRINIAVLAIMFILIIVRLARVKLLKKRASRIVTFCINLSISFILMLLYEQANIYFDTIPIVRMVLGILTMFSVLHLCYTTMKPINKRLSNFFLLSIFIVSSGNVAKQYLGIDASTLVYSLACSIITVGIVTDRKPGKKLVNIGLLIATAASIAASVFLNKVIICLIIYIFSIVLMNVVAGHMDKRLRFIIGAFMLPSCLSVWESYTGGNVKIHTFLVLAYSVTLLIMIAVILYQSYKIEKAYQIKKAED